MAELRLLSAVGTRVAAALRPVASSAARTGLRIGFTLAPGEDGPPSPAEVHRILVVAYHGLGNFVLYLPTLRALRASYGHARIDLLFGPETGFEELAREPGLFDTLIPLRRDASWADWWRAARTVRRNRYDLTISEFHSNSGRLALLMALSRARARLGHVSSPGWRNRWSFLYSLPVRMEGVQHETERYASLLPALGVSPDLRLSGPFLQPDALAEASAGDLLASEGLRPGRRFLAFQIGTSPAMSWKRWDPEKYAALACWLAEDYPDDTLVFLGSAEERSLIEQAVRTVPAPVINLAGRTSVAEAAAILKRAAVLIGNDSGLMHLAAAVGTPVVAVFGPTDLERTGPVGGGHVIVRTGIGCSPCFRLEGMAAVDACPHRNCLAQLGVEPVREAAAQVLEPLRRAVGR